MITSRLSTSGSYQSCWVRSIPPTSKSSPVTHHHAMAAVKKDIHDSTRSTQTPSWWLHWQEMTRPHMHNFPYQACFVFVVFVSVFELPAFQRDKAFRIWCLDQGVEPQFLSFQLGFKRNGSVLVQLHGTKTIGLNRFKPLKKKCFGFVKIIWKRVFPHILPQWTFPFTILKNSGTKTRRDRKPDTTGRPWLCLLVVQTKRYVVRVAAVLREELNTELNTELKSITMKASVGGCVIFLDLVSMSGPACVSWKYKPRAKKEVSPVHQPKSVKEWLTKIAWKEPWKNLTWIQ